MTAGGVQQALEISDLFSFDTRRHRVVEWQAPGPVAKASSGMSGLETMCAIRDGILPPPPMARLIGFEMRIAEAGRIVMELDPDESLENTIGLLHGGAAAALLDTAMGCAIATMHPIGQASVTLDLKVSAEGKVVKLGRQSSYAEGFVRDGAGNLAVHATATFTMIGGENAK